MSELVEQLLQLDQHARMRVFASLEPAERRALYRHLDAAAKDPWARFEGDPVRFVTEGLGEAAWSRQREVLHSLEDNKRTAVPACHAPGKSHIAARAVAYWVSVYPPGTAQVVTTASTFRQVRNVLWPHIRRVAKRHKLPGHETALMTEWQRDGEIVAFGFSPADHDEAAVQGIHAPHLLVIVDEAGGLGMALGTALESLMTGGHTRMLVLGNPPTDEEDTWFERICESHLYNVIRIGAYDTPNFTGEDAGVCRSCPPVVPEHPVTDHLVDDEWVNEVAEEFGEESPFVVARVHAQFPRQSVSKAIPLSWVEMAGENEEPTPGERIRLGVDVAADGGDEFVIAKADGSRLSIDYHAAGSINENAVDVAGVVLEHIHAAETVHAERDVTDPVRVKLDTIGVGWGVVSMLERWGEEGKHGARIIGVNVAETAREAEKFSNQRAEMWWTGRLAFQPRVQQGADGVVAQQVAVADLTRRLLAQLSGPMYKADSQGRIAIERKKDLKKRGATSPDRAEAMLLALYEPPRSEPVEVVAPIGLGQANPWRK